MTSARISLTFLEGETVEWVVLSEARVSKGDSLHKHRVANTVIQTVNNKKGSPVSPYKMQTTVSQVA